jgi:hypothetical protein
VFNTRFATDVVPSKVLFAVKVLGNARSAALSWNCDTAEAAAFEARELKYELGSPSRSDASTPVTPAPEPLKVPAAKPPTTVAVPWTFRLVVTWRAFARRFARTVFCAVSSVTVSWLSGSAGAVILERFAALTVEIVRFGGGLGRCKANEAA